MGVLPATSRVPIGCGVGLVAAAGVWVNCVSLSDSTATSDEPIYAAAAWKYVHGSVAAPAVESRSPTFDNFEHPPLAKYLFGLAQLVVGHSDITADRVVAAICTLLTAVVLGGWLAHVAGRWIGLLAAALTLLLPEAVGTDLTRFARTGMLEPVAELFMVISLVTAWYWFTSRGRNSWLWAVGTGAAVGLAAGSKENGFLGAIGPILLGLVLAVAVDRREQWQRLVQAATAVAVSAAVFLGLYLPLGGPVSRVQYLLRFQNDHRDVGHLVGFDGQVSRFPPWWTNFWFAGNGIGVVCSVALLVAVVAALFIKPDRLVAWLLAAIAVPVLFHCVLARVTLPFYWTMWTPAVFALAAIGIGRLATLASSGRPAGRGVAAVAAVAVIAAPVWSIAGQLRLTFDLRPTGAAALPGLYRRYDITGYVGVTGLSYGQYDVYIPGHQRMEGTANASLPKWQAIAVSQPACRTLLNRSVRAAVAVNLREGNLELVYEDRLILFYRVLHRLTMPTRPEIAAIPKGALTDNC